MTHHIDKEFNETPFSKQRQVLVGKIAELKKQNHPKGDIFDKSRNRKLKYYEELLSKID